MNVQELSDKISARKNYLCVGLDTDLSKIPPHLQASSKGILEFNKSIIDATKNHCVSYKINTAFYESMGSKGWDLMEETLHYITDTHFTIADAKRGDIGNTSAQYAKTFFETLPFDAVTVAPYMGEDSIKPFLAYENKTTIVLGLTSNAGALDFQQQQLSNGDYLYAQVLKKVASWGSTNNLMFVIGATRAADLADVRKLIPNHFLLVPGVGAQGGSLSEVSTFGWGASNCGLLVNVSRGIIYVDSTEQYAEAASNAAAQYAAEMATYYNRFSNHQ